MNAFTFLTSSWHPRNAFFVPTSRELGSVKQGYQVRHSDGTSLTVDTDVQRLSLSSREYRSLLWLHDLLLLVLWLLLLVLGLWLVLWLLGDRWGPLGLSCCCVDVEGSVVLGTPLRHPAWRKYDLALCLRLWRWWLLLDPSWRRLLLATCWRW